MIDLRFPKKFMWGASTSAHQVEGNNTSNDWWDAEKRGLVPHQSGKASWHYAKFLEDFDYAKNLGHNAHRFSLEWSRLETSPGKFSEEATVHYRKVLLELRERGLEPVVTLHHFTNPKWFSELGGWTNPKSPKLFENYAKYCVEHFGDFIKFWVVINEPMVYIQHGCIHADWPPFKKGLYSAWKILRNFAKAHNGAYKLIHAKHPRALVSTALSVHSYLPVHQSNILENIACQFLSWLDNHYFLKKIIGHCDFLALNYYFPVRIQARGSFKSFIPPTAARTDMGWEISPAGLLNVLRDFHRYRKPIYITENGIADEKDAQRFSFILNHLLMVYTAITEGIDVRGYLHWSLLDNFEWAAGFGPRFGLIKVDYETGKRDVRQSAHRFAQICKSNAISVDSLRDTIEKNIHGYPEILQRYLLKITKIRPTE